MSLTSSTSSFLTCHESLLDESLTAGEMTSSGKSSSSGDLNFDGIRSIADPLLIRDERVLRNVLRLDEDYQGSNGIKQLHSSSNNNNRPEVKNYFKSVQREIKPHMRKIVADWMMEVCEEQHCHPEVFSLAINYLDRVLSLINIRKSQFQLLSSVCIFLASKFKESVPLCAEKLVVYADFSITSEEITVIKGSLKL